MALDMSNITYGRDRDKINAMIDTYNTYFNNIKMSLKGQEKSDYISAIQNNWVGPDATAYLKKFDYSIAQVEEYLAKIPSILENAIQEDLKQFEKFQNNNANQFDYNKGGSIFTGSNNSCYVGSNEPSYDKGGNSSNGSNNSCYVHNDGPSYDKGGNSSNGSYNSCYVHNDEPSYDKGGNSSNGSYNSCYLWS